MIMHYMKNMMSMMNAWVEHLMNELIKKKKKKKHVMNEMTNVWWVCDECLKEMVNNILCDEYNEYGVRMFRISH